MVPLKIAGPVSRRNDLYLIGGLVERAGGLSGRYLMPLPAVPLGVAGVSPAEPSEMVCRIGRGGLLVLYAGLRASFFVIPAFINLLQNKIFWILNGFYFSLSSAGIGSISFSCRSSVGIMASMKD